MSEPHGKPMMKFEPLLAPEPAPTAPPPDPKKSAHAGLVDRLRRDQRLGKVVGGALAVVGLVGGGSFAWSELRPIHAPDVFNDPFKDVLGFALLSRDFNRLPIEERLALMEQMAEKLRGLSAGDSAMMAAFAAGITGEARAQLEANMRTLMVDIMDKFAAQYAQAADADREKAMEKCLLEMFEMTSKLRFDKQPDEVEAPAESLKETRERATARAERLKNSNSGNQVGAGDVAGVFNWVQTDVNQNSDPGERARTTRFMRDAVRYMRGQDVRTGKPKPKSGA